MKMNEKYEKAKNCYECGSFINTYDKNNNSSETGLCIRIADCGGDSYYVRKNWKRCIFGNHGKKLLEEEIKIRDKNDFKRHVSFMEHLEHARKIVESWPEWKRNIRF